MRAGAFEFCPLCGSTLEDRVPENEDRTRKVCTSCSYIHYENPAAAARDTAASGLSELELRQARSLSVVLVARHPRD